MFEDACRIRVPPGILARPRSIAHNCTIRLQNSPMINQHLSFDSHD